MTTLIDREAAAKVCESKLEHYDGAYASLLERCAEEIHALPAASQSDDNAHCAICGQLKGGGNCFCPDPPTPQPSPITNADGEHRRSGNSKLVYNKETRTIDTVRTPSVTDAEVREIEERHKRDETQSFKGDHATWEGQIHSDRAALIRKNEDYRFQCGGMEMEINELREKLTSQQPREI